MFFPDDCRVCKRALIKWTRVPVCEACLNSPVPLDAEYFCAVCNTPFINAYPLDDKGVCTACRAGLRGFDHAASFGLYEGPLRSLIHLYKYSGMKPLARTLAGFMERAISVDERFDAVVPVPLHWRRQWDRGSIRRNFWLAISRNGAGFRCCRLCGVNVRQQRKPGSPARDGAAMSRALSFCGQMLCGQTRSRIRGSRTERFFLSTML